MSYDYEKIENFTELKLDKDILAEIRTEQAGIRTVQAASRTYAAWVRTGFAILSAGTALGQFLSQSSRSVFSNLISYALISIGLLCFIFGWFGYYRQYKAIALNKFVPKSLMQVFKSELNYISIMTIMLLIICLAAYVLQFLS